MALRGISSKNISTCIASDKFKDQITKCVICHAFPMAIKVFQEMEPVVFLSTSPTFMLVHNSLVPELDSENLVHFQDENDVKTSDFLCGGDHSTHFVKWYDFSRTASSVLRMYMLEASGMRAYYDPDFTTKQQNLPPLLKTSIQMAHADQDRITRELRARRLAAEFDRLFPHCLIEYQLNNMTVGKAKKLFERMYVIYFDERIIYKIEATMDVKYFDLSLKLPNYMDIRANVHVIVEKSNYDEPKIPLYGSKFSRFTLVKQLVKEWNQSQSSNDTCGLPDMLNEKLRFTNKNSI